MTAITSRPAGWYADPDGSSAHRWWDGDSWSDHVAPGAFQAATGFAAQLATQLATWPPEAPAGDKRPAAASAAAVSPGAPALPALWARLVLAAVVTTAVLFLVLHR